jgi:glutamyl-tRNA reductase
MVNVMLDRSHRAIVMIDIAVPRDIDPDVSHIPGIKLFDLDNLSNQVQGLLTERQTQIPLVKAIIAEETTRFLQFLKALDMLPLISEIGRQAEAIRQQEVERTLRRLPDLSELELERIEAMTRSLVKKLMQRPILRLRMEANCSYASEYALVARTLFNLPGESGFCALAKQSCPYNQQPGIEYSSFMSAEQE